MTNLSSERALIFRITHVENLPWIIGNGLWSRKSRNIDPRFRRIGRPDLIGRRSDWPVPSPLGRTLGDYIPFYFTPWSMMLYNIVTGYGGVSREPSRDIIFLVASLRDLAGSGHECLFTDRHAVLRTCCFSSNLDVGNVLVLSRLTFCN